MNMRNIKLLLAAALLSFTAVAHAKMDIVITQAEERAIPIAIVPFGAMTPPPEDIAAIVSADLARSGRFNSMASERMNSTPHEFAQVQAAAWRAQGQDYVAVGKVDVQGSGYGVQFSLVNAATGQQMAGYNVPASPNKLRTAAHQIADIIYEKITGERGAFNTHIAYVTVEGSGKNKTHRLAIADSDGYNEQIILTSPEPLMSPAWSPDGRRLAYVSFEQKRPVVYVQDVYTGARRLVSSFDGINSAPAFSPDGNRLALTLSKDGNAEIYVLDLGSGHFKRITDSSAIETEASWSPDGSKLLFTSDRGGGPQLYQVHVDSYGNPGSAERITFNDSNYNARGTWSPDGKRIAFISRMSGEFYVAVLDTGNRTTRVVSSNSRLAESPSFAPNGSMIIYATEVGGRGVLEAVSVDGRGHQRLSVSRGDVRDPAWSPFAGSN